VRLKEREQLVLGQEALSRLSEAALRSAEALQSNDVAVVADHLYSYNAIAITPGWRRRFANVSGIHQALGVCTDPELQSTLEVSWRQLPSSAAPGWLAWLNRGGGSELGGSGPEFKLYVSPAVDALERVFPELVRVVTTCRAASFKVGADAPGLLRPDKLVAYFSNLGDLAKAAHELGERLEGVDRQGVPFTAEISGDGLLSWGVDPPLRGRALGGRAPSWREWVCYRLAVALIEARQKRDGPGPLWQQALERLRADGVQVDRWLPSPGHWGTAPW